jgi:hypothetical protein
LEEPIEFESQEELQSIELNEQTDIDLKANLQVDVPQIEPNTSASDTLINSKETEMESDHFSTPDSQ